MRTSNKGKPRPKPDHKSKNTGPGKPNGIKSTVAECNKRIRQVADLLSSGFRRSQINEAICSQYGVSFRTVETYAARARQLLMEELGKSRDEHRADVLGKYEQIIRNTNAAEVSTLRALEGKREMLGLDAPKYVKTEMSGPDGGSISLVAKVENVLDFAAVERELSKLGAVPSGNGESKPLHPAITDVETGRLPGANGD